jgi:acetyltransferase-like isoleucine patch superfamily enzyme
MKNFLTQYDGIFRFLNSTKNLFIKFGNFHVLIGRNVVLKNVKFEKHASLGEGVRVNNSELGNHTYLSAGCLINNTSFGKFCSVGSGVKTGLGIHPAADNISTHPAFYSLRKQSGKTFVTQQHSKEEEKVKIGHDVWIGANAIVLDGITIGNGAIIAAGAVVTKDVAPFEIVGGVPAKHIRFRFSPEEIDAIEKSAWWNQDEIWLKKNAVNFLRKEDFFQIGTHK